MDTRIINTELKYPTEGRVKLNQEIFKLGNDLEEASKKLDYQKINSIVQTLNLLREADNWIDLIEDYKNEHRLRNKSH